MTLNNSLGPFSHTNLYNVMCACLTLCKVRSFSTKLMQTSPRSEEIRIAQLDITVAVTCGSSDLLQHILPALAIFCRPCYKRYYFSTFRLRYVYKCIDNLCI